jgi:hypothetical protein
MESDFNKQPGQKFSSLAFDFGAVALMSVVCWVVGVLLMPWSESVGLPISTFDLIAGISWGVVGAALPLSLRHTRLGKENAAAMPILTVLWRFGVVAVAILGAAATKWPLDKSFAASLLGCYFPFVVLESALSIRNISQDTRQR